MDARKLSHCEDLHKPYRYLLLNIKGSYTQTRGILYLKMTLVRTWLFWIQHLLCLVIFWCMLEDRMEVCKKKDFLSIHWGANLFHHAKRCWNEFGPHWTAIGYSSFKFEHYLQACATSGMKLLILYAKPPIYWYIRWDQLPIECPIELKHNSNKMIGDTVLEHLRLIG